MISFINEHTFRCLLGPQSKNVQIRENIYSWDVGKKHHFSTDKQLNVEDLEILRNLSPSNFHYLSPDNIVFLKEHFKISKVKNKSILLNLDNFSLQGSSMKNLRQTFNRCAKNEFELLDNFKNIKDVEDLIEEWSNEYTNKYFRDFSGKNLYFYRNNFHKNCLNLFIYHGDILVAFGTLSPVKNGGCSYIIGKALYKRYYGLSEYADIILYKKAIDNGVKIVNLGQASKGLLFYKTKFPNAVEEVHYDGSIEI